MPKVLGSKDLYLATRMVERLLLGIGTEKTPSSRIKALLLKDSTTTQVQQLEQIVRDSLGTMEPCWETYFSPGG